MILFPFLYIFTILFLFLYIFMILFPLLYIFTHNLLPAINTSPSSRKFVSPANSMEQFYISFNARKPTPITFNLPSLMYSYLHLKFL